MNLDYRDIEHHICIARQQRSAALSELMGSGWQWCKRQLVQWHVLHPVAHPS